jgi:transcriptional regulator with XRE-family HTH domain
MTEQKFNGKTLQKFRQERGITQTALCRDLGLTQSCYSKYERGIVKSPSAATVKEFADYFDVPYESFFAEMEQENIGMKTNSSIPERIDVHIHVTIDWGFK